MKLISHLLLVLTVTLVTACGGANSQAAEMTGIMDDITAVLKDVKTADEAKAAKSKLEPMMAKYNAFLKDAAKDAADNAGETAEVPDADELKKVSESTAAWTAELTRIMSNPALGEVLTTTLTPKMD